MPDDETRLQLLEAGAQDARTQLTEHRMGIEHLAKEVKEGFDRTQNSIQTCIAPVAQMIHETNEKYKVIQEQVAVHGRALDFIHGERQRIKERWGALKKAALAIVVAGLGVACKELVVVITHAASK